jgi:hypothetical protein
VVVLVVARCRRPRVEHRRTRRYSPLCWRPGRLARPHVWPFAVQSLTALTHMETFATFHLMSWRSRLIALARLGLDRRILKKADGIVFWRLLGTGKGSTTSPSADLSRTAAFIVWRDESAYRSFLATSGVARRWSSSRLVKESWSTRLRTTGGHGSWQGFKPYEHLSRGDQDGVVAIITRANIRVKSWRVFARAGVEVDRQLQEAPGLIAVCGVGEAPIGRQGTFSLWRSLDDARQFAFQTSRHRHVIDETHQGRWYAEELFARFEPYDAEGRWDGRNPLETNRSA